MHLWQLSHTYMGVSIHSIHSFIKSNQIDRKNQSIQMSVPFLFFSSSFCWFVRSAICICTPTIQTIRPPDPTPPHEEKTKKKTKKSKTNPTQTEIPHRGKSAHWGLTDYLYIFNPCGQKKKVGPNESPFFFFTLRGRLTDWSVDTVNPEGFVFGACGAYTHTRTQPNLIGR